MIFGPLRKAGTWVLKAGGRRQIWEAEYGVWKTEDRVRKYTHKMQHIRVCMHLLFAFHCAMRYGKESK